VTILDPAIEIIAMRRALPELVGSSAQLGDSPDDGIRLVVPGDDQCWLTLRIVAGTVDSHQIRWELSEWMSRGERLPNQVTVLDTGSQERMLIEVDRHYRRLLLERRNAGCGTPTTARSIQ
jgi:hypothetical protein